MNKPTYFVLEGSILCYPDGSMLEFHSQVTSEEWEQIVEETFKYNIYLECIKEIACPKLEEEWDNDLQRYKDIINTSVSRMRNIDALLVAKFNHRVIKESYSKLMEERVDDLLVFIEEVKREKRKIIDQQLKFNID